MGSSANAAWHCGRAGSRRRWPASRQPRRPAQINYSVCDLDFMAESLRLSLFKRLLCYPYRPHRRCVERQDFPTTLREHVRAFKYLGGVEATCLNNMKMDVSGHKGDVPL